jgi:hypothetical protein
MVDFGRSWMDGPHERMDGLHCISEIEMRKLSLVLDFPIDDYPSALLLASKV